MTNSRWRGLMGDDEKALTEEEILQGWHFCPEWDSLLIGPGMGEFDHYREHGVCLCGLELPK